MNSLILISLIFILISIGVYIFFKWRSHKSIITLPSKNIVDVMDFKNVEIPGVNNDPTLQLLNDYKLGHEEAVLDLAKLYMYGVHPFYLPDKLAAGQICNFIIFNENFSKVAKIRANELFKDMTYSDIPLNDRTYIKLPDNPVHILSSISPQLPLHKMSAVTNTAPVDRNYIDDFINLDDIDLETQETLFAQFTSVKKTDAQNVHNSVVQNVASKRLDYIENVNNNNSFLKNNDCEGEFKMWLHNQPIKHEDKENIHNVLNTLNDLPHSKYNKSERDVFNNVWQRINHPVNTHNKEEMRKVFAQAISSAVENGLVVCSTGKIVRMLGSLDAMDAEQDKIGGILRPEWAIDNELGEMASQIRKNKLALISPSERLAYENGENPILEEQLREEFREKIKAEYVDTSIISQDIADLKFDVFQLGF